MSKLHDVPEYVTVKDAIAEGKVHICTNDMAFWDVGPYTAESFIRLLNERDQLRELVKRLEYVCTDEDGCGYSLDASPEQHALIQQIQEKGDASKN